MSELRLSREGLSQRPSADIVVGLGWGDEGKGATVDALVAATKANRVVRFNGGQQAAHNVIANGKHHTFASIGSGTFSNVPTYISRFCTVDPIALAREYDSLIANGFRPKVYVDEECLITTPIHIAANIIREKINGHGTTGTGFGETIYYDIEHDAMHARDLRQPGMIFDYLINLRDFYVDLGFFRKEDFDQTKLLRIMRAMRDASCRFDTLDSCDLITELQYGHTVFEGAQGFVLDENFGFHPHTTWSTTTPANAKKLLNIAGVENVRTIGCLRTYATRHGNGPLPFEGELPFVPHEAHNPSDNAQGAFRTAKHDKALLDWAIEMTNVDSLSVSHYDVFDGIVTNEGVINDLGKPIIMKANGPRREDRMLQFKCDYS